MKALALSVVWTIPLVFFQWLGMPWYWALFATLPVMGAAYLFYYRWVDRHG
jgi:membrane protein implicated in regulation of membrane protease activity